MSSRTPASARRRSPDRRPRGQGRTPPWVALVAVLVTAAALFLAGRAGLPERAQEDAAGASLQIDRTLVCAGGLPAAVVESGTATQAGARSGKVASAELAERSTEATEVRTPAAEAVGAFATQVAQQGAWLAMMPCPEPRSDWWFVGAGASQTHSSTLLVSNPRDGDAVIDVEVFGPKGAVAAPGLRGMFVPDGTTKVLDLAEVAPSTGDVAVHVTTSRGLVAVAATDTFAPDVVGKPVREWVAAQPAAATRLTLTGLPAKPSDATLLIANPGEAEALAEIQVIGTKGTFSPPKDATVRVPPGAVLPVPVTGYFDGQPLAVRVTSQQEVVATVRSQVGGDVSYAGAGSPSAAGSALGVPEGVKAELRLSSVGAAGAVEVASYAASGRRLDVETVNVAAATTAGVALPKGTRHVVLVSTSEEVIAGMTVTGSKGVGSAVFEAAVAAARTPEVRPG